MATPQRIRDDARAAEQQLAALATPPSDPPPAGTPPVPPEGEASLDDRPPSDTPHPNAVPSSAPEPSGAITAEDYAALRHQFETLQGIHNRDVTKMAQTEGRLESLERILAAQAAARAVEPAPTPAAPEPSLLSDAEVKEFGEDLIDVIRRAAREEWQKPFRLLMNDVQRLSAQLATLSQTSQSTSEVVSQSAEQMFNERMDKLVVDGTGTPDWQTINTAHLRGDTKFVDWLDQIGQDSDEPRKNVLVRAYQRKDAEKCAGMFNAYKDSAGLVRGNGPARPSGAAPAGPAPADAFVSPSPVANSSPSTTRGRGSQKVWKLSEIEKVYDDYTKGHYKTDAQRAQYAKLTAEIDQATLEGRVTK
jgi:hypothetical protein